MLVVRTDVVKCVNIIVFALQLSQPATTDLRSQPPRLAKIPAKSISKTKKGVTETLKKKVQNKWTQKKNEGHS